MSDETWKPVGFAPRYEVSNLGRIRSLRADGSVRLNVLTKWRDGHMVINVYVGEGASRRRLFTSVHRLVAVAFLGPAPEGKNQVCHIDGDPANNNVANLKWGSPAENTADRVRHGRSFTGDRKVVQRLTEADAIRVHQLRRDGLKLHEIAKELGICYSHVSAIIGGRRWSSSRTATAVA